MASAVYPAKVALLAVVSSSLSAQGTDCSWGFPAKLITKEVAWIHDALVNEVASIGQVSHRENFTVPVVVMVYADGNDAQAAEGRAWVLCDLICAAVRANPRLSGAAGVTAAYVVGKEQVAHIQDSARAVSITINVRVESKV